MAGTSPAMTTLRGRLGLLPAYDLAVLRRALEIAALHHPVDLLLEFGRLVTLHVEELRHHAGLALLGRQVPQHLLARPLVIGAQPLDRAVERPGDLACGLVVDVVAGDNAATPAQVAELAAASREGAADQRLHQC